MLIGKNDPMFNKKKQKDLFFWNTTNVRVIELAVDLKPNWTTIA